MKIFVLIKCGSASSEAFSHWASVVGAYRTRAEANAALEAATLAAQAANENPGAYYGVGFSIEEVELK